MGCLCTRMHWWRDGLVFQSTKGESCPVAAGPTFLVVEDAQVAPLRLSSGQQAVTRSGKATAFGRHSFPPHPPAALPVGREMQQMSPFLYQHQTTETNPRNGVNSTWDCFVSLRGNFTVREYNSIDSVQIDKVTNAISKKGQPQP